MWPGEAFTRLVLASANSTNLYVQHVPMKHGETWSSLLEYRDVLMPLLYSEWKANSGPFKSQNITEGLIVESTFIETIQDVEKESSFDVFGAQIMVETTKFWNMTNRLAISHITLEFDIMKVRLFKQLLNTHTLNNEMRVLRLNYS